MDIEPIDPDSAPEPCNHEGCSRNATHIARTPLADVTSCDEHVATLAEVVAMVRSGRGRWTLSEATDERD